MGDRTRKEGKTVLWADTGMIKENELVLSIAYLNEKYRHKSGGRVGN